MKTNNKKMIKFIKNARKKLGLSQTGLAVLVGSTRDNITNYETGRCMIPGDVVLKIQSLFRDDNIAEQI